MTAVGQTDTQVCPIWFDVDRIFQRSVLDIPLKSSGIIVNYKQEQEKRRNSPAKNKERMLTT